MSTSGFYPAAIHTMDGSLMRYLFAAAIAVFVFAVDLDSSDIGSIWTEPSFVIAEAQTEPVTTSNSQTETVVASTATASVESSQTSDTINVVDSPAEKAVAADVAIHEGRTKHPKLLWRQARRSKPVFCERALAFCRENEQR